MSNHLESPHPAGTPASGSSAYPSEPIFQSFPWRAAPRPCPAEFPTTVNPDLVYEPRFVVRLLPALGYFISLRLLQAPGDTTYRANATPLYPWRVHSDVLKQVIRCLTLQVDSEVIEVRKERCGPNRSKVTIVLETPEI